MMILDEYQISADDERNGGTIPECQHEKQFVCGFYRTWAGFMAQYQLKLSFWQSLLRKKTGIFE
jgi:hypothetical protein